MEEATRLLPLVPAATFRLHLETSNEYVELYMHVSKVLEEHRDWTVWYPETINKLPLTRPQPFYGPLRQTSGGMRKPSYSRGREVDSHYNIVINPIEIDTSSFRFYPVEMVVEKLRAAGYKVSYRVSDVLAPTAACATNLVDKVQPGQIVAAIVIEI